MEIDKDIVQETENCEAVMDGEVGVDVVELCGLLQLCGFRVRSLDTSTTSDGGTLASAGVPSATTRRCTVVVNCHSSGMHVVLETTTADECSCPIPTTAETDLSGGGVWLVTSFAKGVSQVSKRSSDNILKSPKPKTQEYIKRQLFKLIKILKFDENETPEENTKAEATDLPCDDNLGTSASGSAVKEAMNDIPEGFKHDVTPVDILAPENGKPRLISEHSIHELSVSVEEILACSSPPNGGYGTLKVDTPTRYRSLDTLTALGTLADREDELPPPGPLAQPPPPPAPSTKGKPVRRQETYTISTPQKQRKPITDAPSVVVSKSAIAELMAAKEEMVQTTEKLISLLEQLERADPLNISSASLHLDVSKISLKASEAPQKSKFVSSPNISRMSLGGAELAKSKANAGSKLRRTESLPRVTQPPNPKSTSKLKRLSPKVFYKERFGTPGAIAKSVKPPSSDSKVPSKLNTLLKPRAVSPFGKSSSYSVTEPKAPNSGAKNRYAHIKSTIPRPPSFTKKEVN